MRRVNDVWMQRRVAGVTESEVGVFGKHKL